MVQDELSILAAFLAVAEERSFTRAAKRTGVTPSAMSHAIRGLEEAIGVRLLSRTTRSVAPTVAGEEIVGRLRPALADIREALDHVRGLREKPAGRLRLLVSRVGARTVLAPKLGQFARDYPDISRFTEVAQGKPVTRGIGPGRHHVVIQRCRSLPNLNSTRTETSSRPDTPRT